jgi:hypothetical protein
MNLNSKLPLLALSFAVTLQLRAEEQVFTNLNFAVTPPANWKAFTNTTERTGIFGVVYGAPGGGKLMILKIDSSRKPTGPMNDKFIEDFEKGSEKNGDGKRVSGKFIRMDGVKAYERTSNPFVAGRQTSVIMHAVLTSERFYEVGGMTLKNAADDPDIPKALASFRFLAPAHEPQDSPEFRAYRTGYVVGKYGTLGALIGVTLFFVISTLLKSRRSKPPPLPPTALPPA